MIPTFILHRQKLISACLAKGIAEECSVDLVGYGTCFEDIKAVPDRTFFIIDEKLLSKSSYLIAEKIFECFKDAKIIALGDKCVSPGALQAKNITSFLFLGHNFSAINHLLEKINILDDSYFEHVHIFESPFAKIMTSLSAQEKQVINFLLNGKMNKDIATALNLSPTTVSSYQARVRQKVEDSLNLDSPLDNRTLIHTLIELRQEDMS